MQFIRIVLNVVTRWQRHNSNLKLLYDRHPTFSRRYGTPIWYVVSVVNVGSVGSIVSVGCVVSVVSIVSVVNVVSVV